MSDPGCTTIKEVLARVGDKWSVFVITLLGERTMRFTELLRSIEGISQRMLTLTLRQLERDGLVDRVVYPIVPPRVEYSLTPLGTTLIEPLVALAGWADAHRTDIERARSVRLAAAGEPDAVADPVHRRVRTRSTRCSRLGVICARP